MSNKRQFQRQRRKPIPGFSTQNDAWKVRPVYGFEKQLFANIQMAFTNTTTQKYKERSKIDPARSIYPRDAMGNMLTRFNNRNTHPLSALYLPKYDFIKPRLPVWTIKLVHDPKEVTHHVGPMMYDSVNDKSQLPCKSGWTQTGRHAYRSDSAVL